MNGIECSFCGLINSPSDPACERCGVSLSAGRPVALRGDSTGAARPRVHSWDAVSLAKALMVGSAVECVAIAPLAYYHMGHAGPHGGVLGVLSFLLNLLGFWLFIWLTEMSSLDTSWAGSMAAVFLLQTAALSYILFVYFRMGVLARRVAGEIGRGVTRRRAIPLVLLTALVFVACLSIIIKLAESTGSSRPDGCDVTIISQATSPDGKYVATVRHRRCQVGHYTSANVIEARRPFWSAPRGRALFPILDGLRPVTVRWEGPRRLVVVAHNLQGVERNFFQDTFWEDVDIRYE